jgi:dienelactone hydrolase
MQKFLSVTFALLSSLMLLGDEAGARGGGGRQAQSYGTWFSETITIPGNPELEVTFSKASTDKKTVLFMFTGCQDYAPPQVQFFSEVSRKANKAGLHTVIWSSADARDEEDHCRGKVTLKERLEDTLRVKKFLQEKGIATKFAGVGESQGANLLTRLSAMSGWHSFVAIMPHCDRFSPGGKAKIIVFSGDKDDAAPGAACSKWKAEVHRGADAYHGWLYPRHIGGAVFTRPDGKEAPKLYNADLARRLDQRMEQWFQELVAGQ